MSFIGLRTVACGDLGPRVSELGACSLQGIPAEPEAVLCGEHGWGTHLRLLFVCLRHSQSSQVLGTLQVWAQPMGTVRDKAGLLSCGHQHLSC